MTTTFAFALRPALPADTDFEHRLYASTRDDLRPLGPEVFDGLVGMQFRAQTMSIRLDMPSLRIALALWASIVLTLSLRCVAISLVR